MQKVKYLSSDLIKSKHGFFTREGGVSSGPFEGLNMSVKVGDTEENVTQNRILALSELGIQFDSTIILGTLGHSSGVHVATISDLGKQLDGFDGIVTSTLGLAIGLIVADCGAIILEDLDNQAVGIAHAGWRGLQSGIIEETINHMERELGADRKNITAVVGPTIGPNSYEVRDDVSQHFPTCTRKIGDKQFLDLWCVIEDQLHQAGIKEFENLKIDTYQDERFYSHRRDKGKTGRFLAVVSL